MADHLGALRMIIVTAWRCDRLRTIGAAIEPLGNVLALLSGLWIAMLTTGLLHHDPRRVVLGVCGLVLGVGAGWQLDLSAGQWRLVLGEKVGHAFDAELVRLVATLPGLEHHERPDFRDTVELLQERQGMLGRSLNALGMTVKALCGGATVFVLLVVVHPWMVALVLLALPASWIARVQQRWRRDAEDKSARPGRSARHLRSLTYDRDAGMEIRVFGLADEIAARASDAWRDHRRPLDRVQRRISTVNAVRESAFVLGVVAAIGLVLWTVIAGHASAAGIVLAIYLSQQVQTAVIWPIASIGNLGETLRTAGRMRWLRDLAASATARRSERPAPRRLEQGIVFDDVSFRYPGSDSWALRHVSLRVGAGCVLALVGENGAGKTTLVKLLAGMYVPTEGRILVDGVDLASIDIEQWHRRTAAAFQDFAQPEFTAQHAVGIGDLPRRNDRARVAGSLDRAGATDVVTALADGVDTPLGARWGGVDLSTGQWQKLALGRALMRTNPLVLFFDEPTASLDAATEHTLFERFMDASRAGAPDGTVTVLVSHRFSTVRTADRIAVLADRRLMETGTHAELMRANRLYAELYAMQADSYRHAHTGPRQTAVR